MPSFIRTTGHQATRFVADFLHFGRRKVWLACALVAVTSIIEGFGLTLIIPVVRLAGGAGTGTEMFASVFDAVGIEGRFPRLTALILVLGLAMIVRTVLNSRRELVVTELEMTYLNHKQTGLIATLGAAPWTRVSRLKHARISHLLGHDVYRVGQAASGLLESTVAIITVCVTFTIALVINPVLTLIAVVLLLGAGLVGAPLLKAAQTMGEAVTQSNIALLNNATQFLGSLKLAVSQNLQSQFVDEFTSSLNELTAQEIGFLRRRNTIRLRLTVIGTIVGGAVAFIGLGVLQIDPASLIALMLILLRMAGPIGQFQNHSIEMIRALPAFEQLSLLEHDLRREEPTPDRTNVIPFGDIGFVDVSYAHVASDKHATGLRGFTLDIKAGEFLGMAGPSGAGKTTFADLLVGLYAPQSGFLTVGGVEVDLAATHSWRDGLSYVSQDPFLKNDTVRNNLLWGCQGAEMAEIEEALRITQADVVVDRLPQGLDTVVGERGGLISGGERQRLAIARALLRRPALLILDEATNAIDVAGERALLTRLRSLKSAPSIVMIAHRLESLSLCDRIAIVADGRVVETGTFASLGQRISDPAVRGSGTFEQSGGLA